MQLKHLTDDDIQEYLDGNLSEEKTLSIQNHLKTCPTCRDALKQYQDLYVGLQDDKKFELSRGFAKSVLKKLPAESEARSKHSLVNILLAVVGIIVTVGVMQYYVDLRPLGRAFYHLLLEPLGGLENLLVSLNGSLGLATLAILILVAIGGLDRLIFQPRYKRLRF
jgi:hypothetical protein